MKYKSALINVIRAWIYFCPPKKNYAIAIFPYCGKGKNRPRPLMI